MEVHLIDRMGSDLTVVNAARVSFDKESDWEVHSFEDSDEYDKALQLGEIDYTNWDRDSKYFTKVVSQQDQKLINYLATHNHWTPFSHVQITLREKVPIFVARQRFKHMVGFTYNEVSRRYVDDTPEFFVPTEWRKRAENKKQGSSDEIVDFIEWAVEREIIGGQLREVLAKENIKEAYKKFIDHAEWFYNVLIENDVAPEQARIILPQSMYTEYYTTGSLAAWARAYKLRSDEHAQKEIRDLAKMWQEIIGSIPELKYSWKALTQ